MNRGLRKQSQPTQQKQEKFAGGEVLVLNGSEVARRLSIDDALKAMERALVLEAQGLTVMPPKLYLDLPEYEGDFRAMPAYIDGAVGLKLVSVYPNNYRYSLPTIMATIILCDANTSRPLAIMDGTYITNIRTGAIGGVAVKYLARKNSSTIGFIGAGMQARTQLMAISKVLSKIKEVKVFDVRTDASKKFADDMKLELGLNIHPVETIERTTETDIIVTTTPSREPIVKEQYIRPGTHINAIGADAKGKQELESNLLRRAKIVVDHVEQASHSGEINVPLSERVIKIENIHGTLGEIVAKMKRGRETDEEITIFDSTGLAIQDIICAKLVYEKAKKDKNISVCKLL
jgi:alanine dehydrogenase